MNRTGEETELSEGGVVTRRGVAVPDGAGLEVLIADQLDGNTGQRTMRLPKGHLEPGETLEEAALREAHEEIGLEPGSVEVLGRLDDAWSGAGHHVVPIVGWGSAPPELVASPREVAEILVCAVETLPLPDSLSLLPF